VSANYAIKPSADQALRPSGTIVPRRLIAALDVKVGKRGRESNIEACIVRFDAAVQIEKTVKICY